MTTIISGFEYTYIHTHAHACTCAHTQTHRQSCGGACFKCNTSCCACHPYSLQHFTLCCWYKKAGTSPSTEAHLYKWPTDMLDCCRPNRKQQVRIMCLLGQSYNSPHRCWVMRWRVHLFHVSFIAGQVWHSAPERTRNYN